jgi:hypothetical protein
VFRAIRFSPGLMLILYSGGIPANQLTRLFQGINSAPEYFKIVFKNFFNSGQACAETESQFCFPLNQN